jgi:predicted  nucleic acid-binding Zn-ribbon protein
MENTYKKEEYSTLHLQEEHTTLQEEHTTLQEEHTNLKTEYTTLKTEHTTLQEEYTNLKKEYSTLKKEYSENIIIESMNDMKQRYDRLMQSTVPKHKYTLIYDKYSRLIRYFSGCSVLIDHVLKTIKKLNRTLYNQDIKQIEMELITTRDILEESIDLPFN